MSTVIAFASRKGGSGKSTTVEQLAVYAVTNLGLKTAVLDSDEQQTTYKFFAAREKENDRRQEVGKKQLPFVKYESHSPDASLRKTIKEMRDQYDLILIDTKGGSSTALTSCIQSVDTVVLTTGTAGKELQELGEVIKLVRTIEGHIQDSLPDDFGAFKVDLRVLLTRCRSNTKSYARAIESIAELDNHVTVMRAKVRFVEQVNDMELDHAGIAVTDEEIKNPGKATFQLALDELLKPSE